MLSMMCKSVAENVTFVSYNLTSAAYNFVNKASIELNEPFSSSGFSSCSQENNFDSLKSMDDLAVNTAIAGAVGAALLLSVRVVPLVKRTVQKASETCASLLKTKTDTDKMDEILENSWVLRTKMINPRKNSCSPMDEASMDAILEDSVNLRQDSYNDPKVSLIRRISNFVKSIFYKILGYFKPQTNESRSLFKNAERKAIDALSNNYGDTPVELKARRKEIGRIMKNDLETYSRLSVKERNRVRKWAKIA